MKRQKRITSSGAIPSDDPSYPWARIHHPSWVSRCSETCSSFQNLPGQCQHTQSAHNLQQNVTGWSPSPTSTQQCKGADIEKSVGLDSRSLSSCDELQVYHRDDNKAERETRELSEESQGKITGVPPPRWKFLQSEDTGPGFHTLAGCSDGAEAKAEKLPQDGMQTKDSVSQLNANSGEFTVVTDNFESRLQPVGLRNSPRQQPINLHTVELNQPHVMSPQQKATSQASVCSQSVGDQQPQKLEQTVSPTSTAYAEPVQPFDSVPDHQPVRLSQRQPLCLSPMTIVQTAPPREVVLHPAPLVQVTIEPGPSITRPFNAGGYGSLLPPPPSYEECMKMSKMSGRVGFINKTTQSGSSRQTRYDQNTFAADVESLVFFELEDDDSLSTQDGKLGNENRRASFMSHAHGYNRVGGGARAQNRASFLHPRSMRSCDDHEWGPPQTDHQFLAFISCLFCWPIGLVAIYYANLSHMLSSEGEYEKAHAYSRLAFIASILGLTVGSIAYLIMFFYERFS